MYVKWNEHYSMGMEAFDRDHQKLFSLANKIIRTVEDPHGMDEKTRLFVVREGVKYLKNYFKEHALREEAYMRQIGYPDYAAHKRLHDEFQYVQLAQFQEVIERGACTKDEVFAFVGSGIGWMLEHVTTADMAIVGKGILCQSRESEFNQQALEQEINMLFTATLNIDANAKVLSTNYDGEPFGEAIHQKFVYRKGTQPLTLIAGIEKSLLTNVAQIICGDLADADALVFSCLELFGANFWRTLGERLLCPEQDVQYQESHFLSSKQVQEIFRRKLPTLSILFQSVWGKFFLSCENQSGSIDQMDGLLRRFA